MKRNLLLILSTLFLVLALILLGNMLVIGDKVSLLHPALGWLFYLLILFLIVRFLLYPVYRVLRAPATPSLDPEQLPADKEELVSYGKLLACNNCHITDKKRAETAQGKSVKKDKGLRSSGDTRGIVPGDRSPAETDG
ncbi:MAG: hypothetical protein LUE93_00315 [Bacteroides sp.]|nr:hypothetical protein [Bacteroides sp.]